MSLMRSLAAAMLLPLFACSDGGFNPVAPAASLPGTWVRALDPTIDGTLAFVYVPADTLLVDGDRRVTWSQEVWLEQDARDRVRLPARLEERGVRVFLRAGCDDTTLALCVAPQTVTGKDAPGTLTGTFQVVRTDDDWLRLDMPTFSSRTAIWFRRVD